MKIRPTILRLLLVASTPLMVDCASVAKKSDVKPVSAEASKATAPKGADQRTDDLDEYDTALVADPLEPLNRGTFWLNDQLYTIIFRPISKGYEKVLPKPVRKGIDNAFENVKFPVRFVNSALQGKFKQAGLETEKFLLNTVVGLGGIVKQSDRVPSLADIPASDTGQTFAKWGIGHGAYIVLPLLGPSSLRDTVGLAGDYAMNPVNWGFLWHGGHDYEHDWTMIPPAANTLRSLPDQLSKYDEATRDALDRYLSARSSYIQHRAETARK